MSEQTAPVIKNENLCEMCVDALHTITFKPLIEFNGKKYSKICANCRDEILDAAKPLPKQIPIYPGEILHKKIIQISQAANMAKSEIIVNMINYIIDQGHTWHAIQRPISKDDINKIVEGAV